MTRRVRAQSSGYGLAVLVAGEAHGMAQQMDNACLDLCLGKGRLDGLWEALEAVNYGDEDVLNAPVAQIVQHLCPELGALIGLKPKAQNVPRTVWQDRQCYEDGLVADRPIAADIDPDSVHEDDWIARFQWAVLPRCDLVHDGLSDR